ncbi:MAG: 50S ribosomal protein L15 [Phycisphaerales bacterium]|nr:MAG: 50S ribosomal protein L15 [Phycisphaerales bacterium]
MMIHEITAQAGRYKQRKRVGRGPGSGGKRAGRGQKGAGSRKGHATRHQDEGGQMPLFRTWPKFGFTNARFKTHFWIVNLKDIVEHERFRNGGEVTPQALIEAGLIRDTSRDVKVLGNVPEDGLKAALNVTVSRVSASARRLIEQAGGSVNETGTRRDRVRGIDRNSDDKTPRNLTKKRRRPNFERRQAAKAKK